MNLRSIKETVFILLVLFRECLTPSIPSPLLVALTQTAKKTRDHKVSVVSDIRDAIDKHDTLYLFSYENMRSNHFKNVRNFFRGSPLSRVVLGKNKLMQIALGTTTEDEHQENLHLVAKRITGNVGMLLTQRKGDEVEEYFTNLEKEDYARSGSTASRGYTVTNEVMENFPVSMVEQFRTLGLPVEVSNGRVALVGKQEHIVCRKGDVLSAESCKLLVQFDVKLAQFRANLVCRWKASDGAFEEF